MAIEYTQTFISSTFGASGPTGIQYLQLGLTPPPAGSIFVVKFLSITSTVNLYNTGVPWNLQVITADAIATNIVPIFSVDTGGSILANTAYTIFQDSWAHSSNTATPFTQFIMNQPYLGVNANMQSAGSFTVTISYLVIPTTNDLSANFDKISGVSGSGNVVIIPSSAYTRILKSIVAVNYTDAVNNYTVTPCLLNSGTIIYYIGLPATLAVAGSACWNPSIYLPASSVLSVGLVISTLGPQLNWYASFTSEVA